MYVCPLAACSPATRNWLRSALRLGIAPVTTVTLVSFSAVPWPKLLSCWLLMRSVPITRFGALTQSVLPGVSTTKLPSLPSKVLPARLANAGAAPPRTPPKTRAATVAVRASRCARRDLCSLLSLINCAPGPVTILCGTPSSVQEGSRTSRSDRDSLAAADAFGRASPGRTPRQAAPRARDRRRRRPAPPQLPTER